MEEKTTQELLAEQKILIARYDRAIERATEIYVRREAHMRRCQERIAKLDRKRTRLQQYLAQTALEFEVGKLYIQGEKEDIRLFQVDRLSKTGLPIGRRIQLYRREEPLRVVEVSMEMISRSEMHWYHENNTLYEGSALQALVSQGLVINTILELTADMKKRSCPDKYFLIQKDRTMVDISEVKVKVKDWKGQKQEQPLPRCLRWWNYDEEEADIVEQVRQQGFNI